MPSLRIAAHARAGAAADPVRETNGERAGCGGLAPPPALEPSCRRRPVYGFLYRFVYSLSDRWPDGRDPPSGFGSSPAPPAPTGGEADRSGCGRDRFRAFRRPPSLNVDRPREPLGGVVLRHVVDVDHRRRDVGVAHVRLDVGQREDLHGEGAERVAQVVEAQVLDPGCA